MNVMGGKRLIELSDIKKIERLQILNQQLIDVLMKTAYEIIQYAEQNNIELPYKLEPLIEDAQKCVQELKHPTIINKSCSVCKKLNPETADFCCYCGSSLIIKSISPDLLQSKKNKDDDPKSYRTCQNKS